MFHPLYLQQITTVQWRIGIQTQKNVIVYHFFVYKYEYETCHIDSCLYNGGSSLFFSIFIFYLPPVNLFMIMIK